MRLFIKIVAGCVIVVLLAIGGFFFYMTRGLKAGEALNVGQVNASDMKDGVYSGKYDGGRWTNEVRVTVENNRIAGIDVVKSVLFEKPETTKELFDRVIKEQDTDVDTVTGATVTCRAYLKSVENALSK